jgi:UDP-glucose-4-epimerase GalE
VTERASDGRASQPLRVLVTGGAGYIGSHTVRLLARLGHVPIVLDTLERGHAAAVADARLVVGSTADRDLVRSLLRDEHIDAVLHFAARKSAIESVTRPAEYFDGNVGSSTALLAEVVDAGVRSFVLSSTCAVYGDASSPVAEDAPLRPSTPYGESKLLVERTLPWLEEVGLRHVTLRYFNAAGAEADGSHGEDPIGATNLVPVVVDAAIGRRDGITVFGSDYPTRDGTAIRDYVHVADLARAHVAALEHLALGGESAVLNLGTGIRSSVLDVVRAVERASGSSVAIEWADRRPGDVPAVWADPGAAARVLGWRAAAGLDEIAESAVRWARAHPDGYDTAERPVRG